VGEKMERVLHFSRVNKALGTEDDVALQNSSLSEVKGDRPQGNETTKSKRGNEAFKSLKERKNELNSERLTALRQKKSEKPHIH